jgi:hypothetical protein
MGFFPVWFCFIFKKELTSCSSDGNDGSYFDGRRFGLVGDQLPQEWNQHDEHDTDCEAAGAKLREQLRVSGVGGDGRGAGRFGDPFGV